MSSQMGRRSAQAPAMIALTLGLSMACSMSEDGTTTKSPRNAGGTGNGSAGTGATSSTGAGGSSGLGTAGNTGTGGNGGAGTGGNAGGVGGSTSGGAGGGAGRGGVSGSSGASGSGGNAGSSGGTSGAGGRAGAAGSAGSAGTAGMSDAGGGTGLPDGGTPPTMIPPVKGTCPIFTTGANMMTVNGFTMNVTAWVGTKPPAGSPRGPLVIYWHGTVETGQTTINGIGQAAIDEIVKLGGMVAAPENTSMTGQNTGNGVWFTGDLDFADQIVACAVQQLDIDTRHIHTGGYSAGGLQTVYMWYLRSGYLASAVSFSGGISAPVPPMMQDPSNKAPVIVAHGAMGSDVLILDFAQSSANWENLIKQAGGYYIDCNDGGAHFNGYTRLTDLNSSLWPFFKAHPFKGSPEPYTTLPATFPKYCAINAPGTPP
jgi:hypothetical protein